MLGKSEMENENDVLEDFSTYFSTLEEECASNDSYSGVKPKNPLKFTPKTVVKNVYFLGRQISKAFQDLDFKYWTSGGTTLGLIRHKGLIPWDDDLDLCIPDTEVNHLLENVAKLKRDYGLELREASTFGFRIFHESKSEELPNCSLLNYRYPFCDIFVMTQHKNKYELSQRIARVLWPNEWYNVKDVEQANMGWFGDFQLIYPDNSKGYLTRTYGPEWDLVGETQSYDHIQRESRASVDFDLNETLSQPALPFQ